jgi:energy-coupling factor transporter transmembrane protein EcfT
MVLVAVSAARADFIDLLVLGALILAGLVDVRPQMARRSAGVLWWMAFLGLVFAARALTTEGRPVVSFWGVALTREGMLNGLLVVGRLAVIALAGLLLVVSTRSAQVKAGVQWLLQPIPGLPAARVATMLSLILRFMPMIFDQAGKTSEALKARGIERRRNPLYRAKHFVLPMLRRLFEDTDDLILAMQARGYHDRRNAHLPALKSPDLVFGILLAVICVWLWF